MNARRLTGAMPTRKIGRWAGGGCRWGRMALGSGPSGEAGADAASAASWRAFALVAAALLLAQGSLSPVTAALPLYLADRGAAPARIGSEVGAASLVALGGALRSEEHTSELQSRFDLV